MKPLGYVNDLDCKLSVLYAIPMGSPLHQIIAERERQLTEHGYDSARDDRYDSYEPLARAAAEFALLSFGSLHEARAIHPRGWRPLLPAGMPWDDLARAGAMVLAAMDYIGRHSPADQTRTGKLKRKRGATK